MTKHYLVCDPSRVLWCSLCKTHSTTSAKEMRLHKSSKHPGYLQYLHIFNIEKVNGPFMHAPNDVVSIKFNGLDKDTLFSDPSQFKIVD